MSIANGQWYDTTEHKRLERAQPNKGIVGRLIETLKIRRSIPQSLKNTSCELSQIQPAFVALSGLFSHLNSMRNHYIARQTIGLLLLLVVASVSASHNSAASQLLTRNHRGVAQSFLTPAPVGRTRDATKIDLRATRLIPSKTANQLNVRGGASVVASISDYIGASKFRCWMAITVAIFTDIGATTLLNIATKEKSSPKLAGALSIYLVR
jgi:hypothetical protein